MGKQRKSYTAGRYGAKVTVYERDIGGNIYVSTWDPEANDGEGAEIRRSLGHREWERAKDYAEELSVDFRKQEAPIWGRPSRDDATVERLFDLYLEERTPDKGSASQRRSDRRHAACWRRFLGSDFILTKLSRREWDRFLRDRRSGRVDARGRVVELPKRRPVSDGAVSKDCAWLRSVARWATEYRDPATDELLLERDPTRGLKMPKQTNPSRPVATHDRVDALREVYREPQMQMGGTLVESYLPELLELAVGTGRRIGAICALKVEDLKLEGTSGAPWGAIVWPADTDKMGKTWRCPISAPVREAIRTALKKREQYGRVGLGPLFPDPKDPNSPVDYHRASTWLQRAEKLAGLESLEGGLWHPFRRLWATARKDLPDRDIAKAGGWSSLQALQQSYIHADDATLLRVVTHQTELREAR